MLFDPSLEGKPGNDGCITIIARKDVGLYNVRYTEIEDFSHYLTIIPLHGALYEYAILTPEELYLSTIPRRKTFLQSQNHENVLYLV